MSSCSISHNPLQHSPDFVQGRLIGVYGRFTQNIEWGKKMTRIEDMKKDNCGSMEGVAFSPASPEEIRNRLLFSSWQDGIDYIDSIGGLVAETVKRDQWGHVIIDRSTFRIETPQARVFASFNRYGNSCWTLAVFPC